MISEPMVCSAQTAHVSCVKISTTSKHTETSFHLSDRAGVPDLSVSGDNFDLVVVDPHDPTTMSEPEAPMQSLNQLPMVTNLAGTRST
jgi:hypothetical protein